MQGRWAAERRFGNKCIAAPQQVSCAPEEDRCAHPMPASRADSMSGGPKNIKTLATLSVVEFTLHVP